MSQLFKGMFGTAHLEVVNHFGLRTGQCRGDDFVHNGSWYNRHGEKLGWGDLSKNDMRRICALLEPGEIFVVLSEMDSFWNLPKGLDLENPGAEFIAKHARYILARHRVHAVKSFGGGSKEPFQVLNGLLLAMIRPRHAARAIRAAV